MQIAKPTHPFPLLKLPFELRRMVYREILAPGGIDHHQAIYGSGVPVENSIQGKWGRRRKRYVAAVQYDKQRANFLVASKQINAEASVVFYDDIHTAKVAIFRCMSMDTVHSGFPSITLMPTCLPRLRRLEICFRRTRLGGFPSITSFNNEIGHFTRLCHELAAQCHALKDVILVLSCTCSRQGPQSGKWTSPVQNEEDVCFTAEEFEQVLEPLERVRVSRSLQLKSSCKLLEQLQPVFDRSAAVVRSADPVKELEGTELIWWQLMEKGRPYYRNNANVRTCLHMAHEVLRVPMWMKLGSSYMFFRDSALTLEEDCAKQTAFWKRHYEQWVEYVEQLIEERASRKPQECTQTSSKKRKANEMTPDLTSTSQKRPSRKRTRKTNPSIGG
ncbi:MAG: hypothetical protein Q9208_006584 [Pyrenodesmia sp. 3 TL-2023]